MKKSNQKSHPITQEQMIGELQKMFRQAYAQQISHSVHRALANKKLKKLK